MTTPTRLAPVRRAGHRPLAPRRVPAPPRQPPVPPRKPVSFERVLLWSLLASVVAHVLILIVSPLFIRIGAPPGSLASVDTPSDPAVGGMEWIVPVASESAEDGSEAPVQAEITGPAPVVERRLEPSARPEAATPSGGAAERATEAEPAAGRASVSETLRPGYRDGRLWVNPRELRIEREPSRHEAYMEHLQARIDAANDSTYGRGPDTDWTFTDDEGRRWGVSEKGVHLGGVTIPRFLIPIPSTGNSQSQEETRERARQRDEIKRQEDDRAREEAREATRKAAEERRKRGGGGG